MKSPIRYTKATASKPAPLKNPVWETRERSAKVSKKLAVANKPYNESDKKAIEKNNAPKKAANKQVATKNKQAAAQES